MKSDLSAQQLLHSYSHFMHRYHVVIFTIIIIGGLSVATYLMYQVTAPPSATGTNTSTGFDQATIDRIKNLHSSDDTQAPLDLPSGRTNPFKG